MKKEYGYPVTDTVIDRSFIKSDLETLRKYGE
jgi:hypothetical protein